jgi:hypothetical protein
MGMKIPTNAPYAYYSMPCHAMQGTHAYTKGNFSRSQKHNKRKILTRPEPSIRHLNEPWHQYQTRPRDIETISPPRFIDRRLCRPPKLLLKRPATDLNV